MALAACLAASCGSSPGPVPDADADATWDAAPPDAGGDAGPSVSPGDLYDLERLRDPASVALVFGGDTTLEVEGRFVRSVEYGYLGEEGFPAPETRIGEHGFLFVEVDEAGRPLSRTDAAAVMLASQSSPDDFGVRCPLATGVVCVLAGTVAAPGKMQPPYPSEYADPPAVITDSNELLFNLLREMQRGTDVAGRELPRPLVARAFIVHIARAGMLAMTAAGKVLVEGGLADTPPTRFVVGGHSKWGGAAAQIAAVDDRVAGALAFGFPLDWWRFVELADVRWRVEFGVDLFRILCTESSRCDWTSESMAAFFRSSAGAPLTCGDGPCPGNGRDWIDQIDVRTLREAGWHEGVRFALLRNGREAHPVDTEIEAMGTAARPDQFLFAADSGHAITSPLHGAFWQHWVRHSLQGAPTVGVGPVEVESHADGVTARVTLDARGAAIRSVTLVTRSSSVLEFGPLDGVGTFRSDGAWTRVAASRAGDAWVGGVDRAPGEHLAAFFEVEFDDGSGSMTTVTSAVEVVAAD